MGFVQQNVQQTLQERRHAATSRAIEAIGSERFVSAEEVTAQLQLTGDWDLFTMRDKRVMVMSILRSLHRSGKLDRYTIPSLGAPKPVYRWAPISEHRYPACRR